MKTLRVPTCYRFSYVPRVAGGLLKATESLARVSREMRRSEVQLISRCATTLTALRFSSLEAFSLCLRRRRALHASNVEYCCLFFRISRYRVLTYTFASVLSLACAAYLSVALPSANGNLTQTKVVFAFGEQRRCTKGGRRRRSEETQCRNF